MTATGRSTEHAETAEAGHLAKLTRVYSHETWTVYDKLDRSLGPRSPDLLQERAGEYLRPGAVILDAGCRDGAYLIDLVQAHNVTGVGIEPVALHVERARTAVTAAGLDDRIEIVQAGMQTEPAPL